MVIDVTEKTVLYLKNLKKNNTFWHLHRYERTDKVWKTLWPGVDSRAHVKISTRQVLESSKCGRYLPHPRPKGTLCHAKCSVLTIHEKEELQHQKSHFLPILREMRKNFRYFLKRYDLKNGLVKIEIRFIILRLYQVTVILVPYEGKSH